MSDIRNKVQFDYDINANHFNTGDTVTVSFSPNKDIYNNSEVILTDEDKIELLNLGYDIDYDYVYEMPQGFPSSYQNTVRQVNKPNPLDDTFTPCETDIQPSQNLIEELQAGLENGSIQEMSATQYMVSKIVNGSVDIFRDIKFTNGYDVLGYFLRQLNKEGFSGDGTSSPEEITTILDFIDTGYKIQTQGTQQANFNQSDNQYLYRGLTLGTDPDPDSEIEIMSIKKSLFNIDSIKFYLMLRFDIQSPVFRLKQAAQTITVGADTTYQNIMTTAAGAGENTNFDLYYYYITKVQSTGLELPATYTNQNVAIRHYWDVLNLFTGQTVFGGPRRLAAPFYCETTTPHQVFMNRLDELEINNIDPDTNQYYGSVHSIVDVNNTFGLLQYGDAPGNFNSDAGIGPSFKLLLVNPKGFVPSDNSSLSSNDSDAMEYVNGDNNSLYNWIETDVNESFYQISYIQPEDIDDTSGYAGQVDGLPIEQLGYFTNLEPKFFRSGSDFQLSTRNNLTSQVTPDNLIDNMMFPSDFYFIRTHPGYDLKDQDGPLFIPTLNNSDINYGIGYVEKEDLYQMRRSTVGLEMLPFQESKPFYDDVDETYEPPINIANNDTEFPLPGIVGIGSGVHVPYFHKKINLTFTGPSFSDNMRKLAAQHGLVAKSTSYLASLNLGLHISRETNHYETITECWQVIWQHYLDNYNKANLSLEVTLNGNEIPDIIINSDGSFEFPYVEEGLLEFRLSQILTRTEQRITGVDIFGSGAPIYEDVEVDYSHTIIEDSMYLTTNSVQPDNIDLPVLSTDTISKDFAINLYGGSFRFKMFSNLDLQNSTDENDPFFKRTIPNLLNDYISHGYVPSAIEYPINTLHLLGNVIFTGYGRNCLMKFDAITEQSVNNDCGAVNFLLNGPGEIGRFTDLPMLVDPTTLSNQVGDAGKVNPATKIKPKKYFDNSSDSEEIPIMKKLSTIENVQLQPKHRNYFVVLFNTDFEPEDNVQYTFSAKIQLSQGYNVIGGVRKKVTIDDTFLVDDPDEELITRPYLSEFSPFRLDEDYNWTSRLNDTTFDLSDFEEKNFLNNSSKAQAHRHVANHVQDNVFWYDGSSFLQRPFDFSQEEYDNHINNIIENTLISPTKVISGTTTDFNTDGIEYIYFTYKHSNQATVNPLGSYFTKGSRTRYLAGGLQLAFIVYKQDKDSEQPMRFDIMEPKLSEQDQYRNSPDVVRIGPTVFSDESGHNYNFGGFVPQEGVQADYGVRYTSRIQIQNPGEQVVNLKTFSTYGDISVPAEQSWRSPNRLNTKGLETFKNNGQDYVFEENGEYVLQTTIVDTYRNQFIINQPFQVDNIIKATKSVLGFYSPFQGINFNSIPENTIDYERSFDNDKRPNLGVYYYQDEWTSDIGALLQGNFDGLAIEEEVGEDSGVFRAVDNVFSQSAAELFQDTDIVEVSTYQDCTNYVRRSENTIQNIIATNEDDVNEIVNQALSRTQDGNAGLANVEFLTQDILEGCENAPSYCETVEEEFVLYTVPDSQPAWTQLDNPEYFETNFVTYPNCKNRSGFPIGATGPASELVFGGSVYDTGWVPEVDARPVENLASGLLDASVFKYYDRELQPVQHELTRAPTTVAFLIYKRAVDGIADQNSNNPYDTLDSYVEFSDRFPTYVMNIDWGDGTTDADQTYTNEPLLLSKNTVLTHTFDKPGVHEIQFIMMDCVKNINTEVSDTYPDNAILGYVNYWNVKVRINLSENPLDDSIYIINQRPTLVISGVSKDSVYAKSLSNFVGYTQGSDTFSGFPFRFQYDLLNSNVAASTIDEQYYNAEVIAPWTGSVVDNTTGDIINTGQYNNLDSLGDYIGDTDISTVRAYSKPKRIWSSLGFENEADVSVPNTFLYWKNIIPKSFNIYDRVGVERTNNLIFIDEESGQNWIGGYAYPALPKVDETGQFDLEKGYQESSSFYGAKSSWDSYDDIAAITNKFIRDDSLVVDLDFADIEENVVRDGSGNINQGQLVSDYKLNYDNIEGTATRNDNLFIPSRGTQNDGPY